MEGAQQAPNRTPLVRRSTRPREETVQAIIYEVEQDITQSNGPLFVKAKLKDKLIMVPRDTIRDAMLEHFEAGFNSRYPGKKKATIVRQSLSAIGPYHEIRTDGHEKLAALALKMGDIGLPIYGWKDKWTADLLKAVVPDCRTAGAVSHLYLDYLEDWQETIAPDIDPAVYHSAAFLKSVHNTAIEVFWRWLREKWGINIREHILRGKNERIYVAEVAFRRRSWTSFARTGINTPFARNPKKKCLLGMLQLTPLSTQACLGGLDSGIRVRKEAIQELRDALTEEVGPRESFLTWVGPEFDQIATEVFGSLGISKITLENSWDVFAEMSRRMEPLL
ncbi:hypothetical protein DFH09DRAFT_1421721 [Mycena vulgaris]|nr:hypothetical protein DFH09DRAFT_1421721 [Mycena vulgaris]